MASENILEGKKILIVDDEIDVLESLEDLLDDCAIETASTFEAAKELLKSGKKAFDESLLKIFLTTFTVFPLHSCVRLNSGAVGRVIATYPDQPLRPRLKILLNSQGRRMKTDLVLDLAKEPLLNVVDSLPEPGQGGEEAAAAG